MEKENCNYIIDGDNGGKSRAKARLQNFLNSNYKMENLTRLKSLHEFDQHHFWIARWWWCKRLPNGRYVRCSKKMIQKKENPNIELVQQIQYYDSLLTAAQLERARELCWKIAKVARVASNVGNDAEQEPVIHYRVRWATVKIPYESPPSSEQLSVSKRKNAIDHSDRIVRDSNLASSIEANRQLLKCDELILQLKQMFAAKLTYELQQAALDDRMDGGEKAHFDRDANQIQEFELDLFDREANRMPTEIEVQADNEARLPGQSNSINTTKTNSLICLYTNSNTNIAAATADGDDVDLMELIFEDDQANESDSSPNFDLSNSIEQCIETIDQHCATDRARSPIAQPTEMIAIESERSLETFRRDGNDDIITRKRLIIAPNTIEKRRRAYPDFRIETILKFDPHHHLT